MLFVLGWGVFFLVVAIVNTDFGHHSFLPRAMTGVALALLSAPVVALIAELIVMVRFLLRRRFRGAVSAGLAAVFALAGPLAVALVMTSFIGGK